MHPYQYTEKSTVKTGVLSI